MAVLRPFKAMRPSFGFEDKVIAKPYDVVDRKEASEEAKGNKYSFLHITRSEIDLPKEEADAPVVYEKAKENIHKLIKDGIFMIESKPMLYLYRQECNGHVQTGIVGCVSSDDYEKDIIKRHETTRYDKEKDRENHVYVCNANTEPVFLTYRNNMQVRTLVEGYIKNNMPEYDITDKKGVNHKLWAIKDDNVINGICGLFEKINDLYIADGHNRALSAYKVAMRKRKENPQFTGNEEFNYFLAVIYPDSDLNVMEHNRLIKDLNGNSIIEFMERIKKEGFSIKELGDKGRKPEMLHTFTMCLDGKWYELTAEDRIIPNDKLHSLDVCILQEKILGPILGIKDVRNDNRIDFVGGELGTEEIERKIGEGMSVAFCLYPLTVQDIMEISDMGEIMPPKSTWFEPKPVSGLFVHLF